MYYQFAIVDPDATSQLQLEHFLDAHGDFSCSAVAKNADEGLNMILKYSPDIVFINLNDRAAEFFRMVADLHQYLTKLPYIIGLSKTTDHAYGAIKNSFFDYWLMPFNEFDIRKSILRLHKQMPQGKEPQMLCLKSYSDFQYINTNDILYLQADNNATDFVMVDGSVNNAFKTLKTFEQQLPDNFVRIHQSYIVNTDYVSRINYGKHQCTLASQGRHLPFSRSYRTNVDALKNKLAKKALPAIN
ncbi:MAG: LytR/AlgR family response regulator transcription factor [Flavobacteriaceae bacterium]